MTTYSKTGHCCSICAVHETTKKFSGLSVMEVDAFLISEETVTHIFSNRGAYLG